MNENNLVKLFNVSTRKEQRGPQPLSRPYLKTYSGPGRNIVAAYRTTCAYIAADEARDGMSIGAVVYPIETGVEIAASFCVGAEISEYGGLLFSIEVGSFRNCQNILEWILL